jgi:hypothetical protein
MIKIITLLNSVSIILLSIAVYNLGKACASLGRIAKMGLDIDIMRNNISKKENEFLKEAILEEQARRIKLEEYFEIKYKEGFV